ncbi:hypothetical protein ABVT39_017856 [Epinephelus coioides]
MLVTTNYKLKSLQLLLRTFNNVKTTYRQIMKPLGIDAWTSEEHTSSTRIVDMFHSHIDTETMDRILATFVKPESHLRCVVTTVAFGLGVQVPDVCHVAHWGPAFDILSYWGWTLH